MISAVSQNRFNAPQRLQRNNNQNISASKVNFGKSQHDDEAQTALGGIAILCASVGLLFHCATRDISAAIKEDRAAKKIVTDSLHRADSAFKAAKK